MSRLLCSIMIASSVSLLAVGPWLAPAAYADKVKNCGTTDVTNPPNGNAGFTQTNTQTSACNSSSDTGSTQSCVMNKNGKCTGQ